MSRAGVVKPAQEMGSSRLKCTSCRMSLFLVRSAMDVVTIVRPSKSTTRKKKYCRSAGYARSIRRLNLQAHSKKWTQTQDHPRCGLGLCNAGAASDHPFRWEAQRMKLASEVHKRSTGKSFYILDEPTTGLLPEDISRLIKVLERLWMM